MHVMVQGAAGFVASYLLPSLVQHGARRLSLVDSQAMPESILHRLSDSCANVQVYKSGGLPHPESNGVPEVLISLAGVTDVDLALTHPDLAMRGNLDIAMEVASWARNSPRTRVVYLSSDEVLGASFTPLPNTAPLRPTQPYAASKAAAEIVLQNYLAVYGINLVILRSCNLVGGNQRARKLIPVAVNSLVHDEPVPVYGAGTQVREWLAVQDLCEAILLLAFGDAPPGVYQAASGTHLSVTQVVRLVAEGIGMEPRTRSVQDRLVHDASYAMCPSKLKALGWQPKLDAKEAIRRAAREMVPVAHANGFPFTE